MPDTFESETEKNESIAAATVRMTIRGESSDLGVLLIHIHIYIYISDQLGQFVDVKVWVDCDRGDNRHY